MKRALVLAAPDGCSLSPGELDAQRGRAGIVRSAVERIERSGRELAVRFSPAVDRAVLAELIATERACCSVLAIDYDEQAHVLRVGAGESPFLDAFAAFVGAEEVR